MTTIRKSSALKQSYWEYGRLVKFIQSLIESGMLHKKNPSEEVFKAVHENTLIAKYFARQSHKFTKRSLEVKLPKLIWNQKREKLLETSLRDTQDIAEVVKKFSYIPKRMLNSKIKELQSKSRDSQKKAHAPPVEMRTKLPKVNRYIVTAAQNATPIHKGFWQSLQQAAKYYDAELVVIPGRYKNPTSQWTQGNDEHEWWDNEVLPYLSHGWIKLNEDRKSVV